jgi:hypothetical protein
VGRIRLGLGNARLSSLHMRRDRRRRLAEFEEIGHTGGKVKFTVLTDEDAVVVLPDEKKAA